MGFTIDQTALICVAAGAALATCVYLLAYFRQSSRLHRQIARAAELEAQLNSAQISLSEGGIKLANLERENKNLTTQLGQRDVQLQQEQNARNAADREKHIAVTQLKERELSFEQQFAQFEVQQGHLKKEFELLAHKIFEQKGKDFELRSKDNLDAVLQPFKAQIEGFQKRVNEVHTESVQGQSKLEQQIKSVLDIGLKMSDEANTLASALKGDKKAQGGWSEVQAELLLEMAGLAEGREYRREASYKSDDGRDQRPDFVLMLPNNKHIILDSKISLNAYVSATAAASEEERLMYMKAHVDAIRQHVKSLSDKNYPKLKGVNSPEYVFMFVGNEPAYLAAAEFSPNLFQEAYRKGIAIVTPNTLLSSLRIVSHLWSIDKQNNNTRALAEHASKVYEKLRVFLKKMEKLGAQVNTVQKTYDDAWGSLHAGRGSLTTQIKKFEDMGVSVKERLPTGISDNDEDAKQ